MILWKTFAVEDHIMFEGNGRFYCSLCGSGHEKPEDAGACEQQGVSVPRYLKGEQVQFWGGQFFHTAILTALIHCPSRLGEDEVDYHVHPVHYSIRVLDGRGEHHLIIEDDPDDSTKRVDQITGRIDAGGLIRKAPKVGRVLTLEERNHIFDRAQRI
jgi:hypothetical protein